MKGLHQTFIGLVALLGSACTPGEPPVPWDTAEMIHEAMVDLRQEGLTSEARDIEVLAWRVIERVNERATPRGLPPVVIRQHSEAALLWGRFEARDGASEWLLMDASRTDGEVWQRSVTFTDFTHPRPWLRPGETADGTWHGFNRYAKPPTSREICEFASVNFLVSSPESREGRWHIENAGGVRLQSWRRVTGEEPACGGWER